MEHRTKSRRDETTSRSKEAIWDTWIYARIYHQSYASDKLERLFLGHHLYGNVTKVLSFVSYLNMEIIAMNCLC